MSTRPVIAMLAVIASCAPVPGAHAQEGPGKYALLIGVSGYQFSGDDAAGTSVPKLTFPDDDVRELERVLEKQGWDVETFIDQRASRDQILLALATYGRDLKEEDAFLLYFAGHGVKSKRGRTYWLAYDTHPTLLDYQGVRLSHLLEIVADLPPKTKIVLLDHCFAGDVELSSRRADMGSGGVRDPAAGSASSDWQIRPPSDAQSREILPEDVRTNVRNLRDQMVVIAAARGPAYEPAELKHGLFTYYLLRALETSEADTVGAADSQLTVYELVTYLTKQIGDYATRNGLGQLPLVPPSDADFAQFANLKLFTLPANQAELQNIKRRYLAQLAAWQQPDRGWVTGDTMAQSAELLGRWIDAQLGRALLTRDEQALVEALRSAVDSNVPPREQTRAELFEARAANKRPRPPQ